MGYGKLPAMVKRITDVECRNAISRKGVRKLSDGDGLYLLIYETGKKYWRFRYKLKGKENSLSVGVYPKVSLHNARIVARELMELITSGIDPSAHRKAIKEKKSVTPTFQEVGTGWLENKMKTNVWKSSKHADDVRRRLTLNIFPHIGKRPIAEIDGPELLAVIKLIEKRGSTDLSHKINGNCGQIFRYGIAHGLCKYDVSAGIRDALMPHVSKHQPAVKPNETKKLIQAIATYHTIGDEQTELALKMLAHTFVRANEFLESEWTEYDFEKRVWEIPKERMKMGTDHVVPLTDQTISYLILLKKYSDRSRYVVPSNNKNKTMTTNTPLFALYRLGYKSKQTVHGLRAIASTMLNEIGFNPDVIEMQLAHVERNKVRKAYNRALYLKDRKEMMIWWSYYLECLEKDIEPAMPSFYSGI
ncbi:tyrosine-type recombinase/integrase [Methyloradius palustris]|uniref:Integrase n=1 Tax=Methyloradius palustris TaxID=2778876 RepID=A0A8D5FZE5_9PROT|nr:integrase arm-type DNA-binding domain-containing protein [Methyloradius palustris]BCM24947.1 integrase [Methyloradius palustris]